MVASTSTVNWLFLGELIVVVIATAAFLFYWNRLLGGALSLIIRLVTWRLWKAYINIGSLQISPLAGRIAFRDFEYHSSNISFRATHGNLTFRYWKVRVRQEGDTGSSNPKRFRLPCRIILNIEGAEVFLYNRTPAYDAIVERIKKREAEEAAAQRDGEKLSSSESASTSRAAATQSARLRKNRFSSEQESDAASKPPEQPSDASSDESVNVETQVSDGVSWFQEILPMEIQIVTGSVILGSDATPMVLIVDFKHADGVLDVSEPRSACDYYKMSVNLGMRDVTVLMRTNPDHSGPILAHGKRVYDEIAASDPDAVKEPPSEITSKFGFHWLAKRIPSLFDPRLSAPPIPGLPNDRKWKGLARYRLNDEDGVGAFIHKEETQYAKVTTILKTRALDLCYASDSPGPVPEPSEARDIDPNDQIGNVEPPPEYSVDIVLHGGNINYGPWSDRQRVALQNAFIPSSFFNTEARARLKPGDTRLHTSLVVNVSMTDKTTLRIPTREPSKDWQFDGTKPGAERRYGWMDVVVGPNSSVGYTQAQVPTAHGYDSMLVLHLDSLDISSSVNLESFVVAKTCKFSLTMPTPLVWNAQRNWGLDLTLDTPDIRLLREHVTLISDLSRDWSSGAAGDFRHFVPVHYSFRIALVRFAIHLFINDFNIVDAPRSQDSNAFVDILGPRLDAFVAVSSTRYRPEFSVVPFTIQACDPRVAISVPAWDTHRTFGNDPSFEVGRVGNVDVSGSYRYYSSPRPDHQEKLKLHIDAERVGFLALGWVVRRLFCVKDNYFGGFTQFSTMQEFLEKFDHSPDSVGDPIMEKYRPGRSDSFAVHLTVDVRDSLVFMSDTIYGCEKGIAIPVPQLQLDLKTNEFQMDMTLDAAPTYAIACSDIATNYKDMSAPLARDQDVAFVEGIFIKANRLFGPQPRATTYFCLWELSFARVAAFLSPEFKTTLAGVGAAIGYNFADRENAPASIFVANTPPDATFVKLSVNHVTALLSAGSEGLSGLAVELPKGIFIDTSSMASQACRSFVGLGIPAISAHVLQRKSSRKRWDPVGSLGTGVSVDIYRIPVGWQDEAKAQHDFLREQDEPTRRVPYLYGAKDHPWLGRHVNQIYLPHPKEADVQWPDATSEYTSGSRIYDQGTSSPDWSDEMAASVPAQRLLRRPRSKSAVQRLSDNSVGDESDSVSSTSTSSQSSLDGDRPYDTPTILEERLQSFHRIHMKAHRMFDFPSGLAPALVAKGGREMPYVPVHFSDGVIYRVTLESTTIEVNPETVRSGYDLVGALNHVDVPPENLMDQLLTDHVSAVNKHNVPRSSALYEICLPSTDVRVLVGPCSNPESLVQCSLEGANCRVVNNPVVDSQDDVLDLSVSLDGLKITGGRNEKPSTAVSLVDVIDISLDSRYDRILPFVYITAQDLGLTFHQGLNEKTIQVKANDLSAHGATPGLPIVTYLVHTWRKVITDLPKREPKHALANLIFDILKEASTLPDLPLPAFVHEGSYGLHVDDQRSIRRDPGWFTLARLRQWMRMLKAPPAHERPSGPAMARMTVAELARMDALLGVTEDLVVAQPFLRKAFGKDLKTAGLTPDAYATVKFGLFANVQSLSSRHYGRLLETGAVAISMVQIEGVTLANQRTVAWKDKHPVTDVSTHVVVQKGTVDVQNSFLSGVNAYFSHVEANPQEIREMPIVKAVDHASTIATDVRVESLNVGVTGGGLRLDLSLDSGRASATLKRSRVSDDIAEHRIENKNALLNCGSVKLILREDPATTPSEEVGTDRSLVLATLRGIKCSADKLFDDRDKKGGSTRLLIGLDALEFDSRPQLKAFYDFGRSWRKDHMPLYQPTVDQVKAALAKRKKPKAPITAEDPITVPESLMLDARVGSVRFQARVAKGLWLGWDMGQVFFTRQGTPDDVTFGLRVDPQVVGAYSTLKRTKTRDSSVIRLPSVVAGGSVSKADTRVHVDGEIKLGMFTGIIKPAVLDRLLSLHQRVGNDVAEVLEEYKLYKNSDKLKKESKAANDDTKSVKSASTKGAKCDKSLPPVFNVKAEIAGVRVGLRADDVPTTALFEALDLQGSVTNRDVKSLEWLVQANHVGLSLVRVAHGDDLSYRSTEPLKGPRSVSMVCDIKAEEKSGDDTHPAKVSVNLSRVHTVMHLAALSEVSDLIRSWSNDISVLREVHREEMADVKQQTSKVLKKLDASRTAKISAMSAKAAAEAAPPASNADGTPNLAINTDPDANNAIAIETWFAARQLSFSMSEVGIAIPLGESTIDIEQAAGGAALLYSIRSISLTTSRNETARFRVQQTSLQFVDGFNPADPAHYDGAKYHHVLNRMVLPSIDAEAQLTSDKERWSVNAHCTASDFKLTLTPDIADSVARLGDMYEEGKAQLSQMEKDYLAEWMKSDAEPSESVITKYERQDSHAIRPSKQLVVRMSFRFEIGLVELHRHKWHTHEQAQAERPTHTRRDSGRTTKETNVKPEDGKTKRPRHDNIALPAISVWMDYSGPGEEDKVGSLLFNTAIHESRNTLRPTILPFFVEIVNRIERRTKARAKTAKPPPSPHLSPKASSKIPSPKPSPRIPTRALPDAPSVSAITEVTQQRIQDSPTGKLRLRITLRIDRSELHLSCAPDSNAYIDLKWESGGFSVSTLLGGKATTSIAGSVSGVTAYLSHEFADHGRECVTAGAKDMAIAVTLCNGEGLGRGLSIVVDTQVSVQFRLEALSAWLIFMSVWVDNAPKIGALKSTEAQPTLAPAPAPASAQPSNKLGVAVLVRFRSVDFDANVSVTQARLQMTPIVLRTVSDGEKTEIDFSIGVTQITANGDISGDIRSENLKLTTVRRSRRATDSTDPTVLSMEIYGGDLRGNMFIGAMNIVRFHLEPSTVTLADNWKEFANHEPTAHVALDFVVKAGKFTGVLRLPAIPRLLGNFYSIFDLVESQNKIALQRSETFKTRQKRSVTDMTPMTTVVLPAAQQSQESHVKTAQAMCFELSGIDIGIFSEDYEDGTVADFYRFFIGKIEADLKRREEVGTGLPLRDLLLHVAYVQWQTSDGRRATKAEKHDMSPEDLIEAAIKNGHRDVVVLPMMTLTMKSTESKEPPKLDYDFDVVWGETNGDIMILPNFFESAFKSFRKLLNGIDEQGLKRARRRGIVAARRRKGPKSDEDEAKEQLVTMAYYRRGTGPWNNPVPRLRALGETTGEAAMLIPKIRASIGELPNYSHRFVTLPLEKGMDLLLKLYERQLPDLPAEE